MSKIICDVCGTRYPASAEQCPICGRVDPAAAKAEGNEAAAELRVNPNTVQRAYSLLEEKGLIRSIPKKGAFVIFRGETPKNSRIFDVLTAELLSLKEQGVAKEMIISVIEEAYRQ